MKFFTYILIALLGLVVGVLLNYLADVLPETRKFSRPKCQYCQHPRTVTDYLLCRPCSNCQTKRPLLRYLIVIVISVVIFILVWIYPPAKLGFWLSILLFTYFGLIAIIDIEHRLILNPTSVAGLLIAVPIGIIWNGWLNTLIGGLAGFGIMFAIYGLGILFNRVVSKMRGQEVDEEALGFGDVNLAGVLGFLLGWPKIVISLFFAIMLAGIISGLILGVRFITRSYKAFVPIPYAPFLLIAATILIYMYR